MPLDALIFDVDGTLVDTNSAHVEAWVRAFQAVGYRVDADRIQPGVGMGGDKLVPWLLGASAEARIGDAARKLQPEEFRQIGATRGFSMLPGAVELLQAVRGRGITIALATSSERTQFYGIEAGAGIRLKEHVDVIVTGDDAQSSKPDPDLIQVRLHMMNVSGRLAGSCWP